MQIRQIIALTSEQSKLAALYVSCGMLQVLEYVGDWDWSGRNLTSLYQDILTGKSVDRHATRSISISICFCRFWSQSPGRK